MARFSFNQKTYCSFCRQWLQKNPLPFKFSPEYRKRWEEADRQETQREEAKDPNWAPKEGVVAELPKNQDHSMLTAVIVMSLCGFVGLLVDGFTGLLVGAGVGFAITAVVFIAMEGAKNL